ncbi:hypothetical protein BGZ99_008518 [Dissophora globulifera]|uniref:LsmAD domain-containing protein n=1 Tax=Dissophora globulifera TaxID=979702 RepID=A0A9P6UPK6_9FUNG|nr:hypothetical protein BGZ99_008518 [Dissophora globulifera]
MSAAYRGGKGKWGAQTPGSAGQPGLLPSNSTPALVPSGPNQSSTTNKEVVVNETDSKHLHDRMLFLLSNMIGMNVEITVKNGSRYEGLFHSAFTEGDLGIVLWLAKAVAGKDKKEGVQSISQMIIHAKDCMAINAVGVDFVPHERTSQERGEREGFKTDTDISRSGEIRERDLKKWAPEEHISLGDNLGESHTNGRAGWDQFAVNERLFGVKTDFDEELYTTKLDRSGADFKAREQQAILIANEIQQSATSNVHLREERGLAVDDSGLDEEDLYGAVVRDPLPASNKYMPPAMRRQQQQELKQQKRPSTPLQTPARPSSTSDHPAPSTPSAQESKPATVTSSAVKQDEPLPSQKVDVVEQAPAASPATTGATVSRSNSTKGGNTQFNLNDLRTLNPVSALLTAATIQGSKNQQIPDHAVDSKQIEDNLAKFAMTARTFATNDKALVNQTKIGLTQRRTELLQKEKDGLAAELKQFGKELTKKLNTPVPDDVKEIFGKKGDSTSPVEKTKDVVVSYSTDKDLEHERDRDQRQEQDQEKEQQKELVTNTKPHADKTTAHIAAPVSVASSKPATETKTASSSSFKFNVKASVFKPNVNATPFTPSFAGGEKKSGMPGGPGATDKNLFFGRSIRKGALVLGESMSSPFKKGQTTPSPSSITPTWPYGQRPFRHLFQVTNRYEEDMLYSHNMGQHGGNGVGGYYAMAPYNYGPSGQYGVPPPMTMAAPNHQHMVPYMTSTGPVPFSQPPPPSGMPHTTVGQGFPQMTPTSASPYAPQGFAPARGGIIPPAGMHIHMYPYPPSPHGGPVMMRYPPPPDMMQPLGHNGMIMHQRPMGVDHPIMQYSPGSREAGMDEGATDTSS